MTNRISRSDISETLITEKGNLAVRTGISSSRVAERLVYLNPARYFHMYFDYNPSSKKSCWLPEGFSN